MCRSWSAFCDEMLSPIPLYHALSLSVFLSLPNCGIRTLIHVRDSPSLQLVCAQEETLSKVAEWCRDRRFRELADLLQPWDMQGPNGSAPPLEVQLSSCRNLNTLDVQVEEAAVAQVRGGGKDPELFMHFQGRPRND